MLIPLLIAHIIIALSSIVLTAYLFVAPSRSKLYASYGLVGLTIATGTDLVISAHARLVSACMTGLVYLAFISVALVISRHRLALAKQNER